MEEWLIFRLFSP